jgi:putative transcriptional regulator
MDLGSGCFLVASPQLRDPNFIRSVVFLIEHNDAGSMGLICNRPLEHVLGELWDEAPAGLAATRIACDGGPVERERGLLLHGYPELSGAQAIGHGLAVGGDALALAARFAQGPGRLGPRLFLGHSGWGPEQLLAEVDQGAWILRHGRIDALLAAPPDDLWARLVDGDSGLREPSLN